MEAIKDTVEEIIDHSGDLVNTYYRLVQVKTIEKASKLIAESISGLAICVFGLLAFLFASIGFAWWIGGLLDNRMAGFLVTAGIFVVLIVLVIAFRRKVLFPFFRNFIIRKIYE